MTNETKSMISKFLLLLAVILSPTIFLFLHYMNGDSVFITQVQNWDAIVWTQNIVWFMIVWVVFLAAQFTVLRQSPPTKYAPAGNLARPPVGPVPSLPNTPANAFCTNCGTALSAGTQFCTNCGGRRASDNSGGVASSGAGYCTNCGRPRSAGASFCTECGSQQPSAAAI